jgi:hypothetical protein
VTARLRPVLSLVKGESPPSYASRLARFHGVGSARTLCLELRIRFGGLVDGNDGDLCQLATVAGVPVQPLRANALQRTEDGFIFRDERLVRSTLRRTRLHACPLCLADDVAAGAAARTDIPADAAVAGRTAWLLKPLRTCPTHEVALAEVATASSAHHLHDFAGLVGPHSARIARLAAEAVERQLSGLEIYLYGRLNGSPAAMPWLDALPWHAAARTCEMLGVVATLGRTPNLNDLNDGDWYRAGNAGFGIARDGEAGIRAFLADLQRSYPTSSLGKEGLQAVFGRFHQWLATERHSAFEPVRDVVFQHVHETTPVGAGDELFGRRFPSRILHSVRTAALESGAHPKRLRKLLAAAGHIAPDQGKGLDHHVLFDAVSAAPLLRLAVGTVSMVEMADYLGAGRVQTKLLVSAGYITPVVAANGDPAGFGKHAFAKSDLDAFLVRLGARAVPVDDATEYRLPIPQAAKRAHCGAMEVVAMMLDGRLEWIGRLAGEHGYLALLVDVGELRAQVTAAPLPGLPPYKVAKQLKTTWHVVKGLIEVGALPVQRAVNPTTRTPVDIVLYEDLRQFGETYASVVELATTGGVHPFNLKHQLTSAGVEPAFDPAVVKATFYLRDTVVSAVSLAG